MWLILSLFISYTTSDRNTTLKTCCSPVWCFESLMQQFESQNHFIIKRIVSVSCRLWLVCGNCCPFNSQVKRYRMTHHRLDLAWIDANNQGSFIKVVFVLQEHWTLISKSSELAAAMFSLLNNTWPTCSPCFLGSSLLWFDFQAAELMNVMFALSPCKLLFFLLPENVNNFCVWVCVFCLKKSFSIKPLSLKTLTAKVPPPKKAWWFPTYPYRALRTWKIISKTTNAPIINGF